MEVVASNAERSSIKYKQVEFMKDKLGRYSTVPCPVSPNGDCMWN